jgi:hypothetical protein
MATTNNPEDKKIDEGVKEMPKDEKAGVVESTRKNLILQKLLSEKPGKEEIRKEVIIEESRTFSEQEIIDLILHTLSESQKTSMKDLKVSKIIRNEKGVVLVMEASLPDADGQGGYSEISFSIKSKYIIQGKVPSVGQAKITTIEYTGFDNEGMPMSGETVANFIDGKWVSPSNQKEIAITLTGTYKPYEKKDALGFVGENEMRECGPEIAEFENLCAAFEKTYDLEKLLAITTREVAEKDPARLLARDALIPILKKLEDLKKHTNIQNEKLEELFARRMRLQRAVGTTMTDNDKVDHTR